MSLRVLLLAGTVEARQIAAAMAWARDLTPVASLAKGGRAPEPLGIATRIGGFGGDDGFRAYLRRERIAAVLDATHPFSVAVSHRSARICAEEGVAYAQFLRPAWRPGAGDTWHFAEDEADAARLIPEGGRVLLTTGRSGIAAFGRMPGREVLVPQTDGEPVGEPPFDHGRWLIAAGPASVADERHLLRDQRIDWLIMLNSGGIGSRAKLDAAREEGVQIAMIRRPRQPDALRLETIAAAMTWLRRLGRATGRGG